MVFTAKPVEGLSSFGERIKKARLNAGLTQEKVSQTLSVPLKYLENLENGELEKLPSPVYIKGFLRKYAKILEINTEALINEYEGELRITRHLNLSPQSLPALKYQRFIVTPKTLSLFFGLIILFLVIGYLFYQLHFLVSPPKLEVFEPVDDFITSNVLIKIIGQTEPGSRLTINGESSYLNTEGRFEQEIILSQGLNNIKIEATNRFGKVNSESRRVMVK